MRVRWIVTLTMTALFACASWAQTPQITGIAHVALRVSDLDAARAFFRNLGFEEAFVFTKDEKATEVFVKINDRQFIELYPRTEEPKPLGLMHVCYETDAAEALSALYAERGLSPSKVVKGGAGNFIFSLHDPEGGLIEITQYLPGSRHTEDRGQHLGSQRIADELQAVKIAAPDISAAEQFYGTGLGFQRSGPRLRIAADQRMDLEPGNAAPQFVFRVSNAQKAAARLKKLGLAVTQHKRLAQVSDPDGNVLVFEQRGSRAK